ncbi:alanine or glycine:cation symporter, AGCS family [Amycolatopsis arida]|uniref:Alanine or glycine:cation symporter, AGCS family n=1 Tax=Amycolatopsis arida TaxID=587909 RepID=A0A1I5MBB2_9PSEU|nr:alanine/glycine:cation symporter family protein [Amycolatopsis arida]TDX94035.1 AGCS family alanine or glycine:cation symporter [Amycolatopsis arida]SFP06799.1 alanine or glycine:cation symporter, AGCS family [Amycolatopsis arida]
MTDVLASLNEWLWNPLVVLALGLGVLLTILTRGVQFRRIPDMIRQLRVGQGSAAGISSFQALTLTLSSRIGVGNIAGVATAIAAGGPGALFWMAVMAFLGGATAFVESTLAQIYKTEAGGKYWGGIPYYIEKGLGRRWLAVVAAGAALVLYGVLAPGVQSNNIAASVDTAMGVTPWVTGVVVVGLFGFVVLGGRRRIVAVADTVVPFMAVGYVVAALVVVAANASAVPSVVGLVLASAFGADSVFGGIVGAAVAWGVRRALFSNVAGVGEGTYGSAAAEVSHPVKQGLVQSFSIYVDTLFVCMATGLMILITGRYNVQAGDGGALVTNVPGVEAGPAYTQAAIDSVFAGVGPHFVALALALFAFTTLVAFAYIAETSLTYLTRGRQRKGPRTVVHLVMVAVIFYGSVESADLVWAIGDVGYASLAWVNMVCLVFLARPALIALRDYDRQRRQGLDPRFDPVRLGIPNADFWVASTGEAARHEVRE